MTPARTLSLKEGKLANLYVWYENSGYFSAFFPSDKVPLVVDSEILTPGLYYGPYRSHKEAEAMGIAALRQLVVSGGMLTAPVGAGD
jgi:hypothetical protein